MQNNRVKINVATASEIALLFGIGQSRAEAIVAYRETHGYFRCAEDLTKIKGITLQLAEMLAPNIEWSVPSEPEPLKQRSWSEGFFWLTTLFTLLLILTAIGLALLSHTVLVTITADPGAWLRMVIVTSSIATLISFAAFSGLRSAVALSRNRERARVFSRFGLLAMACALGFSAIIILGTAVYFLFYSPTERWIVWSTEGLILVTGLACFIFLCLFMIPQLAVWQRPDLVTSRWLAGVFDAAISLFGLVLASGVYLYSGSLPWWLLALSTIAGVIVIIVSVISLIRNESFFHASLDFLDSRIIRKQKATTEYWRQWLNVRLPETEGQRSLKKALDEIYRPSRAQTLWKVLVFGVGWWIVLTAISAIIEMYVQHWWQQYFGQ